MKKTNIMTMALLAYLAIMAFWFRPSRNPNLSYKEYFIAIGVTLAAIIILRFLRIKLQKIRDERERENSPD